MVVIEPVVSPNVEEEKVEKRIPEVKNPAKDESTASSSSAAADCAAGYASDGFETASEADLTEEDTVGEESERVIENTTEAETRTEDQGETREEGPVELNQEEINEKALTDANNAKAEGNNLFKDGLYEEALLKYDIALQGVENIPSSSELCSVCHANRAACYSKMVSL
ncbi:OLC1v1035285C1 [Oldenlandia corymbosa var. corymbosa]|uniref:OLC1v1035285C1 n=1 Tax=Oldenlandia corymbosa var. corymbosa TaxID=529605 RepID=A0AAV1CSP0_OLDCO|nr:OLC1v1035285C1 [Oldenlandia corymbosa var. corymbosa]